MLNWLILKFFLGTIIFLNNFRTHLMMFLTERKFAPDLVVTWKPSGTPDLPKQAHNSLVSEDAWKKTHCMFSLAFHQCGRLVKFLSEKVICRGKSFKSPFKSFVDATKSRWIVLFKTILFWSLVVITQLMSLAALY